MRIVPIPFKLDTLPAPYHFGAQFHQQQTGANLYWVYRDGDDTGGRVAVHPREDIDLVDVVEDDGSLTVEDVKRDLDEAFAGTGHWDTDAG